MWILLHISALLFNINIILGNLLETFEIFTNKSAAETKTPYFVAAERSGWGITPRRSLMVIEKIKILGSFWSYQLNSTANPAHLAHFHCELAELAVLFSW